jgi:uncharacterized damage-inducible protein DinB
MADRDALLQHYQKTRDELLSAVDGLSDELMTEMSIDSWSVKDHLTHVAAWDDCGHTRSSVSRSVMRPPGRDP